MCGRDGAHAGRPRWQPQSLLAAPRRGAATAMSSCFGSQAIFEAGNAECNQCFSIFPHLSCDTGLCPVIEFCPQDFKIVTVSLPLVGFLSFLSGGSGVGSPCCPAGCGELPPSEKLLSLGDAHPFGTVWQAGSALFGLSRCVSHQLFCSCKHRNNSWGGKRSFTGCFTQFLP